MSLKTEIRANTKQAEVAFKKFSEALDQVNKQGAKTGDTLSSINNHAKLTNQTIEKIAKNTNTWTDKLAHSAQAINGWVEIGKRIKDFGNSFIKIADSANLLNARLKLSTDGIKNFENASKALYSIAQNTANSVDSVSNLFITLNRSFAELGYSQEKTLEVVSTFSQALKASGTASYNANIALKQLNDALAVGVLKGTDFKVLIQNAPALLGYLSDALGVTAGELKAMASDI